MSLPTDISSTERDALLREQVTVAARVIGQEGYGDLTLGHVSVCDRARGVMYIKRKGVALSECERSDVLVHPIDDDDRLSTVQDMHFEAVMHSAVYRRRPDVNSVIHSHPPFATALGVTDASLEVLAHDSIMFAEHGIGVLDSAALITTTAAAEAMADALGPSRAVLLRGHGVVVVGEDVRWATRGALALERAVKIQAFAGLLGNLRPLDTNVARDLFPRKYTAKQFIDRPGHDASDKTSLDEFWAFWCRVVRRTDGVAPHQV